MTARIFAITDVFNARTTVRPYKKPLSFEGVHSQFFVNRVNRVGWASPTKYHALAHIIHFWWAMPTLLLYDKYAGHEGGELRQDLASFIEKYFSTGLEILRYD